VNLTRVTLLCAATSTHFTHSMRVTFSVHILVDLITPIIFDDRYRSSNSSVCSFLQPPTCYFFPLTSKHFRQHAVPQHPQSTLSPVLNPDIQFVSILNWDIVRIISANLEMIILKQMFIKQKMSLSELSLSKHPFYELGTFKLKKVGFLCEMLTLMWNARTDAQIMNSQTHAETMRRIAK